jgi:hypothetical protein
MFLQNINFSKLFNGKWAGAPTKLLAARYLREILSSRPKSRKQGQTDFVLKQKMALPRNRR